MIQSLRAILIRIMLILFLISLTACNSTQTKLNLQEKVVDSKTEYKSAFFNIDQGRNTLEVNVSVKVNSGSLNYTLLDPGSNPIFAGTLLAGDTLEETAPLVPIKGNYVFKLELQEFSGEYHFIISHKD